MSHPQPLIEADLIHKTVQAVLRPEDAFTDLFVEQTTVGVCSATADAVRTMEIRTQQGSSLRRVNATSQRLVHVPSISEVGMGLLIQAFANDRSSMQPASIPLLDTWMPPMPEMVQIAQEVANEVKQQDPSRLQAEVFVRHLRQVVLIGRSDGRLAQSTRYYTKLSIEAVVQHERKIRRSRRQAGSSHPHDLCHNQHHLQLARQAAEAAIQKVEAVPIASGEMTVILGPGGPATLLHEACGHALEADLAQHPKSAYYGRLGEQVAAPTVTVIDDPAAAPSQTPIYHLDDEGEPAQPTVLIEKGVLRNYLYDRRTALAAGEAANGHGRRLSYAYPPLPRMSATYLAPGEIPPADIIKETKYGLFVRDIAGGKTDMGSGRFNLHVNECYLVEDGHLTAPVQGVILSGHGPKVLNAIDRVGNDFEFLSLAYGCNKLDQFPLFVTVGQPTIRVQELAVQGV